MFMMYPLLVDIGNVANLVRPYVLVYNFEREKENV